MTPKTVSGIGLGNITERYAVWHQDNIKIKREPDSKQEVCNKSMSSQGHMVS